MRLVYFLSFLLVVTSCKKSNTKTQLTKITAKTIAVDSSITPSKEINDIIAPYKNKLTSEMEQLLSYSPKDFTKKDGNMQSSLGNLMADLSFEMANPFYKKKANENIDFVLLNNGGIRASIPKGNITTERAFKLMPFENELVVATLSGKKVQELVEYFIRNKKAHPLSKSIELTITGDEFSLKVNGKPFNKEATYNVLTTDYLLNGGDRMLFFKDPKKLVKLDYKMRDAIIDFFKKTDTINPTTDNRVIIK